MSNLGLFEILIFAVPCLLALLIIVAAIIVLVVLLSKKKKAEAWPVPEPVPDRVGEPAAFPPDADVFAPAKPDAPIAPLREPPDEG